MNNYFKNRKGFFTLIGILLAAAIIFILFYILFNSYYKRPALDETTDKTLSEQNIDTSSYSTIVDSTRKQVKDIEGQLLDRSRQLEDMR